jgi:4-diphosphocytidyl-2-C-methyl-D-erythritol kinase
MDSIKIKAPAKVNFYLAVGGKMDNGYHEIKTIMQSISLYDNVTVTKTDSGIEVKSIQGVEQQDLIEYKAAKAFLDFTGIESGVSIVTEKSIPSGAGLGGGSTDGAAVLTAMNTLFETMLDRDTLCRIGATVGADVPACVKKGTVAAEGIGEQFKDCAPIVDCFIVVAKKSDCAVSTKEAYEKLDSIEREPGDLDSVINTISFCDLDLLKSIARNDFELLYEDNEDIREMKKRLDENKAVFSLLTGSGSAVFGVFKTLKQAKAAAASLEDFADTYVCTLYRR